MNRFVSFLRTNAQWAIVGASAAAMIVIAVVYSLTADTLEALKYFQIAAIAIIPAIFPVWGKISRRPFPAALTALFAVHAFAALGLGNALDFYDRVPLWDIFLHTLFGFNAGAGIVTLMKRWNGGGMPAPALLTIAALAVLGTGALWEIYEYSCDLFMGTDIQCVAQSVAAGKSPLADTIEDIAVTIIGYALFAAAYLLRNLFKSRRN